MAQDLDHRHTPLTGERKHGLDTFRTDAARRIVDDAAQAKIVAGVVDHRKVCQHIPDLGTLKKLHAADDLIRHAVSLERIFQRVRLRIHAVQNRIVPPGSAAVIVHHNGGDDKVRLVRLMKDRFDEHFLTLAGIGPQGLPFSAGVVFDDRVRRIQNVLRGAVVLLQTDRARTGVFLFKIEDIRDIRAAEPVNALVVVADDADVALLTDELLHEKILQPVRVLILVDEHVAKLAAVMIAHLSVALKKRDGM